MLRSWFKPGILDWIWYVFTGDFLSGSAKSYFAKDRGIDIEDPFEYHEGDEFR